MAKFLTTRGTSSEIESIINNARHRLVLISPFIQISESLFQTLRDADRRKVEIILVYGKSKLNLRERSQLEQLDNLSLHFLENLHAKCFFNEAEMVITSMNLCDQFEQRNREMGVLVSAGEDEIVFKEAVREAALMINFSSKETLGGKRENNSPSDTDRKGCLNTTSNISEGTSESNQYGHCIRCGISIQHDFIEPFCRDCFSKWDIWENSYHKDSHCHTCGKRAPTSRSKPECNSCYISSRYGSHIGPAPAPLPSMR